MDFRNFENFAKRTTIYMHIVVRSKVTVRIIDFLINFLSTGNWRVCIVGNASKPLGIDSSESLDELRKKISKTKKYF